jgi:hypothetical protein
MVYDNVGFEGRLSSRVDREKITRVVGNNNLQNKILKIPNFVPLKNQQKLVDF